MGPKPRYVFDTNAIISALLFEQSVPGRAFYAGMDAGEILLSQATAVELSGALRRKKFDRYLTREEREQFLVVFLREATVVEVVEEFSVCRDPKDDKFLQLAVSGQAARVVTGDEDLLALHPFRGIAIMTPARFLEELSKGSERGG
jgi:putative PIN family toxin of toxin-antitoxin system